MAKTNKQRKLLKRIGLMPIFWAVIDDNPGYLIVTHRVTGEVKVIDK